MAGALKAKAIHANLKLCESNPQLVYGRSSLTVSFECKKIFAGDDE